MFSSMTPSPTTVTQCCSLPLHRHTHSFISVSFPLLSPLKTCLTKKHYSTESNVFFSRRQAKRKKYTGQCFCFLFLSPPPMCAVVDHVECTSYMVKSEKVASASCCVPFFKKKIKDIFFARGGGTLNLNSSLPAWLHRPTLSYILIQSSCL